jgi:hypothetical protein
MLHRNHEDYLELARHAEKEAMEAKSPVARHSWNTIVEGYRMLAAEELKRSLGEIKSQEPA